MLKIIIAPSDSYRNLKDMLIFSDFHPVEGKEVGENREISVFDSLSIFVVTAYA